MGNNMCPYANIIGEKYTKFIAHHYKYIENNKIEEGTLLNVINMYPHDYHLNKCELDSFKRSERSLIHTFWPDVGQDIENENDNSDVEDEVEEDGDLIEKSYTNGNNEGVEIFNQKCVICLEKIVIMHLDNVVISVFVSNVIKKR